jgi:hypothetical protein
LLRWLQCYLDGRTQKVVVEDKTSDPASVTAGVPQGSILGPILFIIFMNDLPGLLESLSLVFADDVSLVSLVKPGKRDDARARLQADIDKLCVWSEENQVRFAPEKTQSLLLSRKRDRALNGPVSMGAQEIEETASLKLLGVTFCDRGLATRHIMAKAATASKLVCMLRRCSAFLSERARLHLYVALIRPLMEYSSPVFANAPKYALEALDGVQRKACRLFPSANIDSLHHRRQVAGLCQYYRMVNGTAPNLLLQHMRPKPACPVRATRNTESSNFYQMKIHRSKTQSHQASFGPSFSRLWNELPMEAVFAKDLQTFKLVANRWLRNQPVTGTST